VSASSRSERLSAHDALYFASSNAAVPLSVAGLFSVGRDREGAALTVDRLRDHLEQRLDALPRFRQVVRPLPLRLATPRWVDDERFTLDRHVHVHRLADGELEAFVARLNSRELDARFPLWEVHLLEGAFDGGTAMLMRWHHALVDGMSAIHVIRTLVDDGPRFVPPTQRDSAREEETTTPAGRQESLEGWLALLRAAAGPPRFIPGRGRPRWASVSFPERELRAAARRLGASLNEIVSALSVGAIAHVLAARGDTRPDDTVRTLIPIVTTAPDRERGLGNHGAHFVTKLPVSPMEEDGRVRAVAEAMRKGRQSHQVEAISRGMERLEGAPVPVILLFAKIAGVTGPGEAGAIDLIVSFMPGPRRGLSFAGHPLERAFPVLPIGPRARLTVGGVSLGGTVGIGVTAGTDVLPELDLFMVGLCRAARSLGVEPLDG
jgi:diacylglycerol O-acyltransferase / wax synthase